MRDPTPTRPSLAQFNALDAAAEKVSSKDQPNGYAGLNENGELEGPIIARDSNDVSTGGGSNDVPASGEIVTRDGVLAVGDNSTIGGIKYIKEEALHREAAMALLKPNDGLIMVSRKASGNVSIKCETNFGGQYAVDWWDGTRTLHNSGVAATKATANNSPKIIKAYPAITGQDITVVDFAGNDLTSVGFSGLPLLEEVEVRNNQLTSVYASGLESLRVLQAGDNELSVVSITDLPSLEILYVDNNNLASLDTSGLTKLVDLVCNNNNLTSLDISGMTLLFYAQFQDNNIAGVDAVGFDGILSYGHTSYSVNFSNNDLDTDAVWSMLDQMAAAAATPSYILLTGNPCDDTVTAGANLTAGATKTQADVEALLTAKGYSLILDGGIITP